MRLSAFEQPLNKALSKGFLGLKVFFESFEENSSGFVENSESSFDRKNGSPSLGVREPSGIGLTKGLACKQTPPRSLLTELIHRNAGCISGTLTLVTRSVRRPSVHCLTDEQWEGAEEYQKATSHKRIGLCQNVAVVWTGDFSVWICLDRRLKPWRPRSVAFRWWSLSFGVLSRTIWVKSFDRSQWCTVKRKNPD